MTTYYARASNCNSTRQGYYFQQRFEPWVFRKDIFYYVNGKKTRQRVLAQNVSSAGSRYRIKAEYTSTTDQASALFKRYGTSPKGSPHRVLPYYPELISRLPD
jgi:hypothetical protein